MHRRFFVTLLFICLLLTCSTCAFAKESDHISAGDALEGANKAIYDYLSEQIAQVAAGKATQTVFFVDAKDLDLDRVWTTRDFGVDHIWEDVVAPDGKVTADISAAVKAALDEKLALDLDLVMSALLFDYPYELYWYDKTYGATEQYCYAGSQSYSGINDTVYLDFFQFSLTLSQDYAVISGKYWYPNQPDLTKLAKAPAALAEAKRVVAANAEKSDYEKLVAYKDYICNAVSYNSAASGNENYSYGNPWQVIYVFDGNSRTNVVCEGYAKAFQLLCDLTDFDQDVQCILAEGQMSGGTGAGAGAHMWNIVQINGASYLVDVTNCDKNTIGHPDELFLVGNDKTTNSKDCDFLVNIAKRHTVKYSYGDLTHRVWDEELLQLETQDFDPAPATFAWSADFQTCTATINGQTLPCTVSTLQEASCLTLTASVTYNGRVYTDEEIIRLDRDELTLPKMLTQQQDTVWVLVAGYENGRLTDLQLVEHIADSVYDLSDMEGDLQVFVLNAANQAPLLPSLHLH